MEEYPGTWLQQISDGYRIMLINWAENKQTLVFNLDECGIECSEIRDFWSDAITEITGGKIVKELPPHSCYLGVIKNKSRFW